MARALWHENAEQTIIKSVSSNGEGIHIDSVFSFISQGTERMVSLGLVPKEAKAKMKVPFMKGDFGFPCSYGYSLAGIVNAPGHQLDKIPVHLMHPHQDHIRVPESALRPIPDTVSMRKSLLVPNMETAINAVWNSQITNESVVLILGFGSIGALTAIAIRQMTNATIHFYDTNKYRSEIASNMGFQLMPEGTSPDTVFHSTASESGLQFAIDTLKPYGRVVELSWYGDRPTTLKLGGSFHYENKSIISSQVSTIPPHMRGWDFNKRLDLVWQLLGDESCESIIDREIPFEEAPEYFRGLRNIKQDSLGVCIKY